MNTNDNNNLMPNVKQPEEDNSSVAINPINQANSDQEIPTISDRPTTRAGWASLKEGQNKNRGNRRRAPKSQEFAVEVIKIKKICKVVKGGRRFRFSALVVIGNKKGKVGFGQSKAYEVPDAIKKAQKQAMKNTFIISMMGKENTIAHEAIGVHGASKIFMKPAPEGTGVVAGGSIRLLLELSGIKNIYTKSLGSRSELNMILATAKGLKSLRTPEEIARLRDKDISEVTN